MTSLAPLFLAFLLNCCSAHILTRPKNYDKLPYLPYVVFLLSICFLLSTVHLIPIRFKKLYWYANFIIEFVIGMVLIELIVNNVWFPLEMCVLSILPKLPLMITSLMQLFGFKYGVGDALDFLKSAYTLWIASYIMSIFFFISISHATGALDFQMLNECGLYNFIKHAAHRACECLGDITNSMFRKKRRRRGRRTTTPFRCTVTPARDDFDSDDFSSS